MQRKYLKTRLYILLDEIYDSLVLEYADGGTLREYLRKNARTLKWENQLRIAKGIASAISCLHGKEIIHRDLVSSFVNYVILII